jgi:hypothetical protein
MPAKSKAQQKFMGMVHALQKGEIKPSDVSSKVKKTAKSMKKKDADDFASTKHKGLPNKVKKEELYRLIAKYGAKKVRESIFAVKGKEDPKGYRHAEKPNFKYDEGFGGQLKGKDKKEFEKARKENAEVLGYELTGTKDIKESVKEGGPGSGPKPKNGSSKVKPKKDATKSKAKEKDLDDDAMKQAFKDMEGEFDFDESVKEAKSFKPEKRRKLKSGEVEVMKGRGSKQKWFYLKDKNDVHKLIRLGRNYGFPTGITNNNSRIDKSFIKRLSINEADEITLKKKMAKEMDMVDKHRETAKKHSGVDKDKADRAVARMKAAQQRADNIQDKILGIKRKKESVNEKVIKVSKKDDVPGNPMKMKGEEKIKKLAWSGSVGMKKPGSYEIKGNKLNVNNIRPRDKGFFVRHFTMGTGIRKANLYYDGVHWQGKKKF